MCVGVWAGVCCRRADLDFKGEVLLQVLDDHDKERQLDAQRLPGVGWAGDVGRANVGPHNLNHQGLDVVVCDALDVTIADLRHARVEKQPGEREHARPSAAAPNAHLLVPDLQRLAADAVVDGEEARLERVLEHGA